MEGTIFNIQRFSVHDGPGIRTTVFFMGCPLRCKWCHNPEGLRQELSIAFDEQKCIACGACAAVCPMGVHQMLPVHSIDWERCHACGACVRACPAGALRINGKVLSAKDVVRLALRDAPFYGKEGGITCSGGEATMQLPFLLEVLQLAHKAGLHTALDTCGYAPWDAFAALLPFTDLFLYDIKAFTPALHQSATGVTNERILNNYRFLYQQGAHIWVRIPVIPGFNDTVEEMQNIKTFLQHAGMPEQIKLIPYHPLGKEKYTQLGMKAWSPECSIRVSIERLEQVFSEKE